MADNNASVFIDQDFYGTVRFFGSVRIMDVGSFTAKNLTVTGFLTVGASVGTPNTHTIVGNLDVNGTITNDGIRPYKVYTALLTQTGTDAPVATVLENTLGGTLVWSRRNVGQYAVTLVGAFVDELKIPSLRQVQIHNIDDDIITVGWLVWNDEADPAGSELLLNTGNYVSSTNLYTNADALITNYPVEIRVYN